MQASKMNNLGKQFLTKEKAPCIMNTPRANAVMLAHAIILTLHHVLVSYMDPSCPLARKTSSDIHAKASCLVVISPLTSLFFNIRMIV